ncbi:FkbM family methyltransferase [Dysgonomonas alginatilytica]|uniref:FkbM family methyltransferase n=1 Tax=Dysgonomonas alginatilytica TaxID=1605892 RepID=UPI00147572FB|nr:FkbM family methyltransferase [Dysgonomonas alginatilytica]
MINKGDVVLDIGANLGYYSIPFAKQVGKSGKVHSVEPIKVFNKIFNEIAKKYDNIILYPFALGTEEKLIQLVSSPQTGYFRTGLPHVYDSVKDGDLSSSEFSFEAQMKIPSKLFGSLDRIDYIKCDIEGFEYLVLSEMKEVIRRHKPKVQVEVWGQNEKTIKELFDEMGYTPFKLNKNKLVSLNSNSSKIEGDYIFIHKQQASNVI